MTIINNVFKSLLLLGFYYFIILTPLKVPPSYKILGIRRPVFPTTTQVVSKDSVCTGCVMYPVLDTDDFDFCKKELEIFEIKKVG